MLSWFFIIKLLLKHVLDDGHFGVIFKQDVLLNEVLYIEVLLFTKWPFWCLGDFAKL